MKYRGEVKKGVVILERPNGLTNGTIVTVEPVRSSNGRSGTPRGKGPKRGTMGAILRHAGTWVGEPGEIDRLLAQLRQMKEAEVAAQRVALGLSTPQNGTKRRAAAKRKRHA